MDNSDDSSNSGTPSYDSAVPKPVDIASKVAKGEGIQMDNK